MNGIGNRGVGCKAAGPVVGVMWLGVSMQDRGLAVSSRPASGVPRANGAGEGDLRIGSFVGLTVSYLSIG